MKLLSNLPDNVTSVTLNVEVANKIPPHFNDTATLKILIMSVVVDAPVFSKETYHAYVMEVTTFLRICFHGVHYF